MGDSKLVVVTGGPGVGKTALIEELRRRGYVCSSEVAHQIIQEQVNVGGDALPWANRERYAWEMLARSVASWEEYSGKDGTAFFDRGIPDTLYYVRLVGLSAELEAKSKVLCRECRYSKRVFLAPPWRKIYETDTERKQSFEEAVRTHELMVRTYEDCGYEVVLLPRVSIEERAEFIISETA